MPQKVIKPASKAKNKDSNTGALEQNVPPNSTVDPSAPEGGGGVYDDTTKEVVAVLQEELDQENARNAREVQERLGEIHLLRKENERIQRKQIAEYGMTLDAFDHLTLTCDAVKSENDRLYDDMEQTKEVHDKLANQLRSTQKKFDEATKTLEKFKKDTKLWNGTLQDLMDAEARCNHLRKNNKRLRYMLHKHHIDPNVDAKEIHSARDHDKDSVATFQTNTTLKTYRTEPASFRKHTQRRRQTNVMQPPVPAFEPTIERPGRPSIDNTEPMLYTSSAAYLNYYVKKRSIRQSQDEYTYRPGLMLPRVVPLYRH